jgi:prepilin-type N-terminal cleavage/methylation domain-containing protein
MKRKTNTFRLPAEVSLGMLDPSVSKRLRNGMTLIELLLVIAIMVVVASLVVPNIQRTFARQALQKGADRVRVAMGQARVRAIKNGEEFAVFYVPGGSWFNVAPFTKFKEQSALATRREKLAEAKQQSDFEDDLLPRGILFAAGEVSNDARSMGVLASAQSGDSLRTILFYPDGTSQDAKIILQNDKENFVEIQLRGLTGIAKSVRVEGNPSIR